MKILLADDDPGVIEALVSELKSIPAAEVRVASTGDEALAIAMEWGALDVLVTDVFMEPMNGFTLHNKIQNRIRGVRTIFISGHDLSSFSEHTAGCRILQKPFSADALKAAVLAENVAQEFVPAPILTSAPHATVLAAPEKGAVGAIGAAKNLSASRKATAPIAALTSADLVGQTLGDNRITRVLGEGKKGFVYEALQISISRPVALKVLSPKLQQDTAARTRFIADARAKINVKQPSMLAAYEVRETGPYAYYTSELVDGTNLSDFISNGRTVDDSLALHLIRVAGEGLAFLKQQKISHSPLTASDLYVRSDKVPRLRNLATRPSLYPETEHEMASLAQIIQKVLPGGESEHPGIQALIRRLNGSGSEGFESWGALLQAVKALEAKPASKDFVETDAPENVTIQPWVEPSREEKRRRAFFRRAAGVIAIALLSGLVYRFYPRANERDLEALVEIPAGDFICQPGDKVNASAFWIDKYEVTIGQYARFLEFIHKNPEDVRQFEHPLQPRGKSHTPKGWEDYYPHASAFLRRYRKMNGVPIDLNCPVFGVDWWDAYAYAKWKGCRLPTELEWEKAARGTDGFFYPWGNEFNPKKCNSAIDYNANPSAGGKTDGYALWSPVDAFPGDCSPFKVYDMAGNVAEWTDSWEPSGKFPIIRGGSYLSTDKDGKPDVRATKRLFELYPEERYDYLGFRTATSTPPKK